MRMFSQQPVAKELYHSMSSNLSHTQNDFFLHNFTCFWFYLFFFNQEKKSTWNSNLNPFVISYFCKNLLIGNVSDFLYQNGVRTESDYIKKIKIKSFIRDIFLCNIMGES